MAPRLLHRLVAEEAGDRLEAAIPAHPRRHRPGRVLGQHRDDRRHVAAFHRVGIALSDRLHLPLPERPQRRLLALFGKAIRERLARALQRAVHGRDRRAERLGDLAGGEAEHLAHDQHRTLPRRQQLQGGDERQLDALALLVARRGRQRAVGEPELHVGVRLEPDGLGERWLVVVPVAGGPIAHRAGAAPAGAPARSGTRWSRSGTARRAASCAPRTPAARARRAGARLAARPRRREPSRACGSSGRGAPCGVARAGGGTHPRRPSGRSRAARAARRSRLPGWCSSQERRPAP